MDNYNRIIDFTYLKEDCTTKEIEEICETAKQHNYYSVCCFPEFVKYAKDLLKGSDIKTVTVVSFPSGIKPTAEKLKEATFAIKEGADEIDMVINYMLFKQGEYDKVQDDIIKVSELVHKSNKILKVIIESGLLSFDEVKKACDICVNANVDFVKTSTGKLGVGAEIDKVKYMREILPSNMRIKAAGGIKTLEQLIAFAKAGADRIGTSSVI